MNLGLTATRNGLRLAQYWRLMDYLTELTEPVREIHHGCCIGGDAEVQHIITRQRARSNRPLWLATVYAHPSNIDYAVDQDALGEADVALTPQEPLARNHVIVESCDLLLVCPGSMHEQLRSGTWATWRHAMKVRRRSVVFFPDGTMTDHNFPCAMQGQLFPNEVTRL